jgi:hypothetical protein
VPSKPRLEFAKSPKNGKERTVALAKSIAAELRNHRVRQGETALKLGMGQSGDGLVVAQADGRPFRRGR